MKIQRWDFVAAAAALLLCGPAHALFKVVGPDGKITYTDRPPATEQGKRVPLGSSGAEGSDNASLPYELRAAASKFPVVLYTTPDCPPCDRARDLLRSRGIPYRERTAASQPDMEAWQQQVGSLEAPALAVGSKTLNGLAVDQWHGVLDAAGYPRDSRLPASYRPPAPQPLAGRAAPKAATAPEPEAAPAPSPVLPTAPAASGGIRF